MSDPLQELKQTVARLRAPGGCPWDIEQTHESLCACLVEEVSELLDTIDRGDTLHMREELGDVLLQVVFHAQIETEAGTFTLEDVAAEVNEKLVRRHPHVFGDSNLETSEEVLARWEEIKAEEKKNRTQPERKSAFKDLPPQLPALLFAHDVFRQIVKKDLPAEGVTSKTPIATLADGLDEESLGRQLFELAAAARLAGLDPESALRRHARRVMAGVDAALSSSSAAPSSSSR